MRDAVLGDRLVQHGLLQHLVEAHQSGTRDYRAALWTLLMFEAFLRQVVDGNDAELAAITP